MKNILNSIYKFLHAVFFSIWKRLLSIEKEESEDR